MQRITNLMVQIILQVLSHRSDLFWIFLNYLKNISSSSTFSIPTKTTSITNKGLTLLKTSEASVIK